jgi:hypothetical protein
MSRSRRLLWRPEASRLGVHRNVGTALAKHIPAHESQYAPEEECSLARTMNKGHSC